MKKSKQDAHKLDGRYAAFGQLTAGYDVLDAIASVEASGPETWNKPLIMPIIEKVEIIE